MELTPLLPAVDFLISNRCSVRSGFLLHEYRYFPKRVADSDSRRGLSQRRRRCWQSKSTVDRLLFRHGGVRTKLPHKKAWGKKSTNTCTPRGCPNKASPQKPSLDLHHVASKIYVFRDVSRGGVPRKGSIDGSNCISASGMSIFCCIFHTGAQNMSKNIEPIWF